MREAVEDRLRALVLPDDDGGEGLARVGVPREHRLALVVEAERADLRRVLEELGDRVDDGVEDLVAVLLHPSGMRVARLLAPPGLLDGAQAVVVEDGLDRGGAFVEAEDHDAHHRPEVVGARAGRGARSAGKPRISATCSAMPSDAVRPVERIAATLTSSGHARERSIR